MPWSELAGQDRAVKLVRRALAGGQLHHAYLLVGPDGIGKELFARLCAQAANCEAALELRPCGGCAACAGILRGNFADVFWVRPQSELVKRGTVNKGDLEGAPSREIRVDEVRQLARRLSFALVRGRRKVVIVSPADALNERAQNALLKTLEEPPPDTTFFLITSQPDLLLPTVRSRCARLPLAPLGESVIEALLLQRGTLPQEAKAKAARALGSLGRALELTGEELERQDAFGQKLREVLAASDERSALDLAEELSERDDALELVRVLRDQVREALFANARSDARARSDAQTRIDADLRGGASPIAAQSAPGTVPPAALLGEHDLCDEVEEALEGNGNPRLQLERLLLTVRSSRARAQATSGGPRG